MIVDIDAFMIDSESMYYDSDDGMTALHVAAMLGKLEAVKFLLDHGANIDKKDGKHQRSALDIAKMKKHNSLVEYLVSQGAKLTPRKVNESLKYNFGQSDSSDDDDEEPMSGPSSCKKQKMDTGTDNLENVSSITTMKINDTPAEVVEKGKNEETTMILQPLIELFLKEAFSVHGKMTCLFAMNTIISRDSSACDHLMKKEIVNELANLVSDIFSKNENNQKDIEIIANILANINSRNEGKKLINEMKLSFGAFERLRVEMKKYGFVSNPQNFVFDSDHDLKVKNEIKLE